MDRVMNDEEKFLKFHRKNPDVYAMIVRFAREARAAGKKKISVWLLANRVRWETEIVTVGGGFKIPNGTFAYYARLIMALEPEFLGFFDCRPLKCGEPVWSPLRKVIAA